MSKQATTKRSKPITAWLKKENKEKDSDESEAKTFKPLNTLRVCLEPLDENILNEIKSNEPVNQNKEKSLQKKENKEIEIETKPLRRSARNCSSDVKLEESPQKEPCIEDLPVIEFKGHINYVTDFYDCANICENILTEIENTEESIVPIGFDLEWPFSFQTGSGKTALAQICLSEKECHLLHIYNIKKLPASFIALLSHTKVKLVGVNIKNDIWKLTRDFKEFPGQKVVENNCLDCGPYANSVIKRSCRWSLDRLTAYMLKKKLDKDPSVRRSKWHILPLSDAQKRYAATDAYVSLLLHLTIEKQEALSESKEAASD